jgi:predicted metalloprotease with PDZ domain
MKRPSPILYSISPKHPGAHIFEVTCSVDKPDPAGQVFALPTWIPGSYMIREFARHIVQIRAESGGKPVALQKTDKHTWRAAPTAGRLTLTYEVYAWDLSVRAAHLDTTHGFFNGPSVFLRAVGREGSPCQLAILPPAGKDYKRWQVATAMPRKDAKPYGFGTYLAQDYDELIDHPVEMGEFTLASFKACGVPHDIVITGRHRADLPRLKRDLKTVCEQHIRFFGGVAPMARYVFLVTALGSGYGGLEHRASTALLCSRDDLPQQGVEEMSDAYRGFLGLCSHEYFHTWNVKRIKPAAFTPYDLNQENYTRLLWVFEGITSYYDDLALMRCGLISPQSYLELLGQTVTNVLRGSGRLKQNAAESSFDAWIKYYRQDENSPNAIVSYYAKGALIALALDLTLRSRSKRSLDDVMMALWVRFGQTGIGMTEDDMERVAGELSGLDLREFFDQAVRGTGDLPLAELLATIGIDMQLRPAESSADKGGKQASKDAAALARRGTLGARIRSEGNDAVLSHVFDKGAAQAACLSAGDVLIAANGLRLTASNWESLLGRYAPGERMELQAFRRDELMRFDVTLQAPPPDTAVLSFNAKPGKSARKLRSNWLQRDA